MMFKRVLTLRNQNAERPLSVTISDPREEAEEGSVRLTIDWPDNPFSMRVHGVDTMQAAALAMQVAGARLYTSQAHAEGRLSWQFSDGGYGFPVPSELTEMLVGEDRGTR